MGVTPSGQFTVRFSDPVFKRAAEFLHNVVGVLGDFQRFLVVFKIQQSIGGKILFDAPECRAR